MVYLKFMQNNHDLLEGHNIRVVDICTYRMTIKYYDNSDIMF